MRVLSQTTMSDDLLIAPVISGSPRRLPAALLLRSAPGGLLVRTKCSVAVWFAHLTIFDESRR
jgi:hypothetical protein